MYDAVVDRRTPKVAASPDRRLPKIDLLQFDELCEEGRIRGALVDGFDLMKRRMISVDITDSQIISVNGSSTEWIQCTLDSSWIERCDLANAVVEVGTIRRCKVSESKLIGALLGQGFWADTVVKNCTASMSRWRFTKFRNVNFEDTALLGTDWTSTQLKNVSFTNCDMTGADFSQSRMEGVHFSGCTLNDVHGLASLTGASMDQADAMGMAFQFARLAGITVKDRSKKL